MAHVMMLEDDAVLAGLVSRDLQDAGHAVQHAANGTAALEKVRATRFDVLLLDICIRVAGQYTPDGGLLLMTRVRAQPPRAPFATPRDVRIIAMSGAIYQLSTQHILSTAESLGADAVLGKPFPPDRLLALIAPPQDIPPPQA